jgi:hypothetical protein
LILKKSNTTANNPPEPIKFDFGVNTVEPGSATTSTPLFEIPGANTSEGGFNFSKSTSESAAKATTLGGRVGRAGRGAGRGGRGGGRGGVDFKYNAQSPQLIPEPELTETEPEPEPQSEPQPPIIRGGRRGGRAQAGRGGQRSTPQPQVVEMSGSESEEEEEEVEVPTRGRGGRFRGGRRGGRGRGRQQQPKAREMSNESDDDEPAFRGGRGGGPGRRGGRGPGPRGRARNVINVEELSSSDSESSSGLKDGHDHSSDLDGSFDSDFDSSEKYMSHVQLCFAAIDVALVVKNLLSEEQAAQLTELVQAALEILRTIKSLNKEGIKKRAQQINSGSIQTAENE